MPVVWAALAVIGIILVLWIMGLMGRGVVTIFRHIDWRGVVVFLVVLTAVLVVAGLFWGKRN
jgi:hypothetical protein